MNRIIASIPIHLDALWLETKMPVTQALADFEKLPYVQNGIDYHSNTAWLSGSILSSPFQNENTFLEKGVHLHWSLPDALTKGEILESSHVHPEVPNRWLITRNKHKSLEKQWVVESDYLHRGSDGQIQGSIAYPLQTSEGPPFRYLGRKIDFNGWSEQTADRLTKLTAIGYGEPAFAAFYPSCQSVFGCFDPEITSKAQLDGLSYQLIGWYSTAEKDPMLQLLKENAGKKVEALKALLKTEMKWQVEIGENEEIAGMTCFAELSFDPESDLPIPTRSENIKASLGNSGTEALSARLGSTLSAPAPAKMEDQLEYLHHQSGMTGKTLDIGSRFKALRHAHGFKAESGETIWELKPAENTSKTSSLPDDLAAALHELNQTQKAQDQATAKVKHLRHVLFTDWHKYMQSAYPPMGSHDHYPDIDRVKWFLEKKRLPGLEEEIKRLEELKIQTEKAKVVVETQLVNQPYELKRGLSPRFWQPSEPVVLLEGKAVTPSLRHGQDGRLTAENVLICEKIRTSNPYVQKADLTALLAEIDSVRPQGDAERIGFSKWKTQPWNPLFFEWEVEFFPLKEGGNLEHTDRKFAPNFIENNFSLAEDEMELQAETGKTMASGASVYAGRSILTPFAAKALSEAIMVEIEGISAENASHIPVTASAGDKQNYALAVKNWVNEKPSGTDVLAAYPPWYLKRPFFDGSLKTFAQRSENEKADDFWYSLVRAGEHFASSNFLSQALSGFNNALLMHQQGMQLPVSDPLGFDDYQSFSEKIKAAVFPYTHLSPMPANDFLPIRAGKLRLNRLDIIDSFGQRKKGNSTEIAARVKTFTPPANMQQALAPSEIWLPPRLMQAARISFRWLSAHRKNHELNSHPADSPICGWILPNLADQRIAFYDHEGEPLGILNQSAEWRAIPGGTDAVDPARMKNSELARVVRRLGITRDGDNAAKKQAFLAAFLDDLEDALERTEPESHIHNLDVLNLIARPLAIVRAGVSLELKEPPAIHHGWTEFNRELMNESGDKRETDDFEKVHFPIRIGDPHRFNDGVLGFWTETEQGQLEDEFHSTEHVRSSDNPSTTLQTQPFTIRQSVDSPSMYMTLLIDPRAEIHVHSGILPVKSIALPTAQFAAALNKINLASLSAPLLSGTGPLAIPLPNELNQEWSFLKPNRFAWQELSPRGIMEKSVLHSKFSDSSDVNDLWNELLDKGWITEINAHQGRVVPRDQRKAEHLSVPWHHSEDRIQELLDAGHLIPPHSHSPFSTKTEIYEGWVKHKAK